ncbi:MAG: ABC transporter permease subunit, partial [Clostridia bacterium]|nr:ABC transporter permease subunit [Clostridia bacterium]
PMLIPSISHGMGLIILFGNNGVLTRLLNLPVTIYGFHGVVAGSVLYSFPVAFIMISDILKYEDMSPYQAADVLGIPKIRQFSAITFPYLRKPMISVVFAIFTMVVTDYGVTMAIGGKFKTLPVLLYEDAVGQLNYSSGSVIGIVLLVPALAAFLFDLFNKDKGNSAYVLTSYEKGRNQGKVAGYLITGLTSLAVILVIFSFCIQAFARSYPADLSFSLDHFENTFTKKGGDNLLHSVLIALLTSVTGVVVATATAYLTTRLRSAFSRVLHLMAIVSLAVPGLVLGLSYIIVFKQSFIYGTLAILIMVNTVHFFASPYLMIYNAFGKMTENLEDVGSILGVKRFRIIFDVILPQSRETLTEMFTYFFVNCMMTISAVSFLATAANKPLSLMINQFEAYNMLECAAVVALLILGVNLLLKGLIRITRTLVKSRGARKLPS